jgi:hypothetical protein
MRFAFAQCRRLPADTGASAGGGAQGAAKVMATLARLKPNTDKETMMKTVDTAVDEVLSELDRHGSAAALPPQFLKVVQETLRFLEACAQFRDAAFTGQAKKRAAELQEAFDRAARTPPPAPAPVEKKAKPAKPKPSPAYEPPKPKTFEEAFSDALCAYISFKFDPFHVPATGEKALPYPLSPQFTSWFEEGIRKHIIPAMVKSRRIKMMAESVNVEEMGRAGFFEMFDSPPKENPVRGMWEDCWSDFKTALGGNKPAGAAMKDKKEEKKGFLGKLGKKKAPAVVIPKTNPETEKDAKGFWKIVKDGAVEGGYDPPRPSDCDLFKALFEYDTDKINEATSGLKQMLRQESTPGVDSREGASRMFIDRQIQGSPAYCGELVALWAYFACSDDFTVNITKSFLASQGTSAKERKARLPFFLRWVPDVVANPPREII